MDEFGKVKRVQHNIITIWKYLFFFKVINTRKWRLFKIFWKHNDLIPNAKLVRHPFIDLIDGEYNIRLMEYQHLARIPRLVKNRSRLARNGTNLGLAKTDIKIWGGNLTNLDQFEHPSQFVSLCCDILCETCHWVHWNSDW